MEALKLMKEKGKHLRDSLEEAEVKKVSSAKMALMTCFLQCFALFMFESM